MITVMKFLSANPKAAQEDRELAISHITMAHQFFSSFPIGEDFVRVAQAIERLATNLRAIKAGDSEFLPTRSGASLLYEIITRFQGTKPPTAAAPASTTADAPVPTWGNHPSSSEAADVNMPDPATILWTQPGSVGDLSAFQPGLYNGPEGFQWMSDDMLMEMFGL
jgi:hypothetical protein